VKLIAVLGALFVLTGFSTSDIKYKYECTDPMEIFLEYDDEPFTITVSEDILRVETYIGTRFYFYFDRGILDDNDRLERAGYKTLDGNAIEHYWGTNAFMFVKKGKTLGTPFNCEQIK
tara:strand:+ start:80 stop:433 length:354 start_codon:yes stop_codon:yes gene_type:complete